MAEEVFECAEPWSEYGGVATVRITRAEIIAHMKAYHDKRQVPGQDATAERTEDEMVKDFCAIHWASKVDADREKREKDFLNALARLLKFADAGYGVGLTWDEHIGALADIGADCQGIATEGDGWLGLATNAIEKALAQKAAQTERPQFDPAEWDV